MKICQLIAGASAGDAITQYASQIRGILEEAGIESHIYTPQSAKVPQTARMRPLNSLHSDIKPGDQVWYHFSIASPATDLYSSLRNKKILFYHNITPPSYFLRFSDGMASLLREGRNSLASLASITDFAVSDSEYNRMELKAAGFRMTRTVPLCITQDLKDCFPGNGRMPDKCVNILFVGRLVPNKRFDDLINVFAAYRGVINRNARLILAGSYDDSGSYHEYLRRMCQGLRLSDSVVFTGKLSPVDLSDCYRNASVFLCLSEHEGFCLPLIESMSFGLPVIALARAAVPETMGGSGVLMHTLDYRMTAELIHLLATDEVLRKQVIESQKKRLGYFSLERLKNNILELPGLLHTNESL